MKRWICVGLMLISSMTFLPRPADAADPTLETRFISFMNEQRGAAGLPPLALSGPLFAVARAWTDWLSATNTLGENPQLAAQLPSGWAGVGENVGFGQSLDQVDGGFWSSPTHRANILGNFDAVGVGVDQRSDGTVFATAVFVKWQPGASAGTCAGHSSSAAPSRASATGYAVLGEGGTVFSFGRAPSLGSPSPGVGAAALALALTPDQHGYWVLGTSGSVFTFGDAPSYGSSGVAAGQAVDLKPTRSGHGYWVLERDGSVLSFGDARFMGSLPSIGVRNTGTKLVPTPSGNGYWILGADGGVFSFGDAVFHGSLPGLGIHNTSVSLAATPSGNGYWVLGADGGIFSFGDASFKGSVPGLGCQAVGVQLLPARNGLGYYVLSMDGQVFAFGDAPTFGQPQTSGMLTVDLGVVAV